VHKKIFNTHLLKKILLYVGVIVFAYSFTKIGFKNNYFVFSIPWILFCFLHNKWSGYLAYIVSFFCLGVYSKWFYLSSVLIVIGVFLVKNMFKNYRLDNVVSFVCFFLVLIESVIGELVFKSHEYIYAFLFALISYWLMRYFSILYISFSSGKKRELSYKISVFMFFVLGVFLYGLDISFSFFNLSLIGIVFLSFITSRISLEMGILYSFLMITLLYEMKEVELIMFFGTSIINFILSKTSKLTLISMYSAFVFFLLYQYNLDYYIGINYFVGGTLYCLIPTKYLVSFSRMFLCSKDYIKRLKEENKKNNLQIANKIVKMEEIFSLVSSKLDIKNRLKKYEKELLIEEINIFDNLLKEFARDIKNSYRENTNISKIEKEIYKYGFDLLTIDEEMDFLNNKLINFNVRCEKREIKAIIVPLINKTLKSSYSVVSIEENDSLGFYRVVLKEVNLFDMILGVGQKAKDGLVCGDSYLVYENENKKIFALSDGMGTGNEAKEKSKLALDLFRKFIDVGFSEKDAVNSINCILKSKYSKDSYATLDLLIYDKYEKQFYFSKNGAGNSYIVNNGEVSVIDGDDLPVGIIDKITFKEQNVDILGNEFIVMASDGVSENKISLLNKFKNKDPQKLVREILESSDEIYDDETLMIIKIKSKEY